MRKSKLKAGEKYGHLILVKKLPEQDKHGSYFWECRCECGKTKIVSSGKVRRGDSCGCVQRAVIKERSLVGKKFGRLLVVEQVSGRTKFGNRLYLCKCDCGKQKVLPSHSLKVKGGSKSCGCLAEELGLTKLPTGEGAFNQLFLTYKISAKRRRIKFDISKEEFKELTKLNCHYCGSHPKQVFTRRGGNGSYIYNGVDRVDSLLGYSTKNCVPCCGDCNEMKNDRSSDEFVAHILKIVKHQRK
ncbi:MAG: hypothetical protein M0R80_07965 [Proteobacteria bacterium]|nr:hypothetical protein [Pseudomonadota bacterium]